MIDLKIIPTLAALALATACAPNGSAPDAASVATDAEISSDPAAAEPWSASAEDEALYGERFQTLLEAFASGAPTTAYDTLGPVRGAESEEAFPAANDGLSAETAAAIDGYADANNSQALIVLKDGVILHEAYFHEADADTLIVGKSLAKPLGVIAVGMAIQSGEIGSLDDPVATYITEWQGTDKDQILVRHLLDMRTGLLPQADAPDKENVLNRAYL
ncbi:MAG: serine hydrolase domain-containing protein, partial [Pseudomonadota bacterium]